MLTDAELLASEFLDRGIHLWVSDGQIRYRAPSGVFTAADRERLAALKSEVATLLEPGVPAWCLRDLAERFPEPDEQDAVLAEFLRLADEIHDSDGVTTGEAARQAWQQILDHSRERPA